MAMAMQTGACAPTSSGLGFTAKSACSESPRRISALQSKFLGRSFMWKQQRQLSSRRCAGLVRAEASNSSSTPVVAPWEFESPSGQFLVSLLQSHPHLFSDAADQQLQQLAADKAAAAQSNSAPSGTDIVLYKRIAQVREQERHKAVVEVIYSLVVQKFLGAGMSLVPRFSDFPPDKQVDFGWGSSEEKLMVSSHSPEVLEVVKDHLGMILGRPSAHPHEQDTLVRASKMKIGHLYAATVVFGYFLRRLDQRYQLDMSVKKALGSGVDQELDLKTNEDLDLKTDEEGEKLAAEANAAVQAMAASKAAQAGTGTAGMGMGMFPPQMGWKSSKLKSYVMSMDQESVQRFSRLRCKESLDVVEKQTQVLFGKPEAEIAPDGSVVFLNGDNFTISLAGLRRLVLEAVAFGSFLWDAESYVDAQYDLV